VENVVLVTFGEPSRAFQAMSELRRLGDEGALDVRTAAVVERQTDGQFRIPEGSENIGFVGTAAGGAIGALIGALAGPLGLLLGGATGAIVGVVADVDEADASEVLLGTVTRSVPPGAAAVVADVDEPAPEVLDAVMTKVGGTVTRRPKFEVEAELQAAEEAARAAEREARRVLRERRKAEGRQGLGDKLSEAKDKVRDKVTGKP
jgi:uncharacterized membrane protein